MKNKKSNWIWSYTKGSKSVKALRDSGVVRGIKLEGSSFKGARDKNVINWGSGSLPLEVSKCFILNNTRAVNNCANKLHFLKMVEDNELVDLIPTFTDDIVVAQDWLVQGKKVVVRHELRGHSGQGIEILSGADVKLPQAPLYTVYLPKQEEYRIHVDKVNGVFDAQKKLRSWDVPDDKVDWQVRTHNNGFIYARDNIKIPESILSIATQVFSVTGLDFGAVDVVYNSNSGLAHVLEINTAPGLTGTTLEKYTEMFTNMLNIKKEE